jgi:broad specificity phosphatase PhoE
MRRILLARHGETAWNVARRLQGHADIPLDEVGRDQARALAARLGDAGITAVWTSDLVRARETGAIVAGALALPAPSVDPELRERYYGIFEGLTRDECLARDRDAWNAWVWETGAPPGGEPGTDATARLTRALHRIAASDGGPVLVVSHGAVMRLFLMSVLGAAVPVIANATTYLVEHDPAGIRASLLDAP